MKREDWLKATVDYYKCTVAKAGKVETLDVLTKQQTQELEEHGFYVSLRTEPIVKKPEELYLAGVNWANALEDTAAHDLRLTSKKATQNSTVRPPYNMD